MESNFDQLNAAHGIVSLAVMHIEALADPRLAALSGALHAAAEILEKLESRAMESGGGF